MSLFDLFENAIQPDFQSEHTKCQTLQEKAREIELRADVVSRQMIQESYSLVSQRWHDMQDNLMRKCSYLNDLADTWEVSAILN